MAAKVKWDRGAWWVFTHYEGKRKKRRVGPTKAHLREAKEIARKINAALALGTFAPETKAAKPLECDRELHRWHAAYGPTFKPSYEIEARRIIRYHLVPFFGSRDLRELREADLLEFVRVKLDAGLAPKTIRNALSVLRRVLTLLQRDGLLTLNPAGRIGELMRRVDRRVDTEAGGVDTWSPEEVSTLLRVAEEHEHRFYPALATLFYTGIRRGELLGLKWEDVDFERRRIHVRRAYVKGSITTPKSGRGRYVAMAPALASLLVDVLAIRRREALGLGWPETPEWVFPSQSGGPIDQDNFERSWRRVRRRAQALGVRPLRLHCARHTYASLALASGKSVRWVADQLATLTPHSLSGCMHT
jgi:integrase